MELFVDDLVECHGDVRVRAMMVPCGWKGFRLSTAALAFIAILWVSASMTVRFVQACNGAQASCCHWTIFFLTKYINMMMIGYNTMKGACDAAQHLDCTTLVVQSRCCVALFALCVSKKSQVQMIKWQQLFLWSVVLVIILVKNFKNDKASQVRAKYILFKKLVACGACARCAQQCLRRVCTKVRKKRLPMRSRFFLF